MQKSIASIYETSINDKFPFYFANVIYIFPDKNIMESNTLLLIKGLNFPTPFEKKLSI